jgi:DNA invertase Pin-like site-specific DNA recombinase
MHSVAQPATAVAAIYARVSTTGQREDGTSLETQVSACQAHAERIGRTVPDELIFAEDWPGTTLDRPRLEAIRQLARERSIGALICYSTDRLSRGPIHLALLAQELDKYGCRLELVTEPIDGSPEGQLLQLVRGWAGKLEHAKIVEPTMRGKREAARRGRLPTGSLLYGYRYRKQIVVLANSLCTGIVAERSALGSSRMTSTTGEAYQRPRRHSGLRFSRKARIPSCASASWLVAVITSTA